MRPVSYLQVDHHQQVDRVCEIVAPPVLQLSHVLDKASRPSAISRASPNSSSDSVGEHLPCVVGLHGIVDINKERQPEPFYQ